MLEQILKKIKSAGFTDRRFDSLLNKKKIAEDLNSTRKRGLMTDIHGDTIQYYSLIKSLEGKYVFVDFWATWCHPCRYQIPFLQKTESLLKDKNIVFLSISIDKDKSNRDWIIACKEEDLYNHQYNFRLTKGNRNKLLKVMNITSIPRYLLYDPNGQLINNKFTTPEKGDFKTNLLRAIDNQ